MEKLLGFIGEQQKPFSNLPFFLFLRDKSIPPAQRLSFAPHFAYFVMSFGELNRCVLREEPTDDKVQKLVNRHTYEDDRHWIWYLEDLKKLGYDEPRVFSDYLKFLWRDSTKAQRRAINQLFDYCYRAPSIQKLIVIEAIESTADVFLSDTRRVAYELEMITKEEYRYFGDFHFEVDSNHSMRTEDMMIRTKFELQLSDEVREKAHEIVLNVFSIFTDLFNELMALSTSKGGPLSGRPSRPPPLREP